MKIKITLYVVAIIIGLVSGKGALVAAQSTVPPIDWGSIQFAFVGSVIGMVFVIGIQTLRKNPKYGSLAIIVMFIVSLFFVSSGVSAFIISGTISPVSLFILVIGLGALLGVGLSSLFFKFRHASIP
jgi:hypothetical protein